MRRLLAVGCLMGLGLAAVSVAKADDDLAGPYVGVTVGTSIARADTQTSTVFSNSGYFAGSSVTAIGISGAQRNTPSGFAGGGLIGYNFLQYGNIILGGEADFGSLRSNDSKAVTTTYPCCAGTAFTVTQQVSSDWLLTARPRVGYMWGNMMAYGTVGLAVAHLDYRELFTDTFANANENVALQGVKTGWTVGGGVEYKVRPRWSVKAEYLHNAFGRTTATSTNLTAFTPSVAYPSNVFTHSFDFHTSIVRFGVNWRF